MPPREIRSAKRARQYEHIKESELQRGRSPRRAKEIAAATVNKQRAEAQETKGSTRTRRRVRATSSRSVSKKR